MRQFGPFLGNLYSDSGSHWPRNGSDPMGSKTVFYPGVFSVLLLSLVRFPPSCKVSHDWESNECIVLIITHLVYKVKLNWYLPPPFLRSNIKCIIAIPTVVSLWLKLCGSAFDSKPNSICIFTTGLEKTTLNQMLSKHCWQAKTKNVEKYLQVLVFQWTFYSWRS